MKTSFWHHTKVGMSEIAVGMIGIIKVTDSSGQLDSTACTGKARTDTKNSKRAETASFVVFINYLNNDLQDLFS
jgi:hypothetical protein